MRDGRGCTAVQVRCGTVVHRQLAHVNRTLAGPSVGVGHETDERSSCAGVFLATHGSVVRAAETPASPEASAALETLCRTYWYPLSVFVRRQGRTPEDAEHLVQEFFARLLQKEFLRAVEPERGRFRTDRLGPGLVGLVDWWTGGKARITGDDRGAQATTAAPQEAR